MHIKTERTPIDLGRSDVYEIDQSVSPRALLHRAGKLKKYLCQVGSLLKKIQTLTHVSPFKRCWIAASFIFVFSQNAGCPSLDQLVSDLFSREWVAPPNDKLMSLRLQLLPGMIRYGHRFS
jgi:hypothetical protein